MRRTIKLTESDLSKIIMESVRQVINEIGDTPAGQYALGQASGRRFKRWDDSRRNNTTADLDSLDVSYDIDKHAIQNANNGRYTTDDFNAGFRKKFHKD